jgi:hypothetical protein
VERIEDLLPGSFCFQGENLMGVAYGSTWQEGDPDSFNSLPPQSVPEKRLFSAILLRAFLDLRVDERQLFNDANNWISSHDDESVEFSFAWICDKLNITPSSALIREYAREVAEYEEEKFKSEGVPRRARICKTPDRGGIFGQTLSAVRGEYRRGIGRPVRSAA